MVDAVQKYKHKNFAQIPLEATDQDLYAALMLFMLSPLIGKEATDQDLYAAGEALDQLFAEELSYIRNLEEAQPSLE